MFYTSFFKKLNRCLPMTSLFPHSGGGIFSIIWYGDATGFEQHPHLNYVRMTTLSCIFIFGRRKPCRYCGVIGNIFTYIRL